MPYAAKAFAFMLLTVTDVTDKVLCCVLQVCCNQGTQMPPTGRQTEAAGADCSYTGAGNALAKVLGWDALGCWKLMETERYGWGEAGKLKIKQK